MFLSGTLENVFPEILTPVEGMRYFNQGSCSAHRSLSSFCCTWTHCCMDCCKDALKEGCPQLSAMLKTQVWNSRAEKLSGTWRDPVMRNAAANEKPTISLVSSLSFLYRHDLLIFLCFIRLYLGWSFSFCMALEDHFKLWKVMPCFSLRNYTHIIS